MKQLLLAITTVLLGNIALSQTADQVFEQYLNTKKEEQEFQVTINYAIYKGITGKKAYESYSGLQARYNGVSYQKLGEMELAKGEDFMVKLNRSEKAMLVGLSSEPIYKDLGQFENASMLKLFETKTLENLGNLWKLSLTSKGTILNQFAKIELYLNKKNLRLTKQVIIYASASDFSLYDKDKKNPEIDVPRLDITYKNYRSKITLDKALFEKSRYFQYQDNKITASANYQGFEIMFAK